MKNKVVIAKGLIQAANLIKTEKAYLYKWATQVRDYGYESLAKSLTRDDFTKENYTPDMDLRAPMSKDKNAWYDHELTGNRAGQRSSGYGAFRIVYKVQSGFLIVVEVVHLTTQHKY